MSRHRDGWHADWLGVGVVLMGAIKMLDVVRIVEDRRRVWRSTEDQSLAGRRAIILFSPKLIGFNRYGVLTDQRRYTRLKPSLFYFLGREEYVRPICPMVPVDELGSNHEPYTLLDWARTGHIYGCRMCWSLGVRLGYEGPPIWIDLRQS
jgi:hypothetical protein